MVKNTKRFSSAKISDAKLNQERNNVDAKGDNVSPEEIRKMSLANTDIAPEIIVEIQKLFDKLEQKGVSDSQFLLSLSCYKRSAIVGAAKNIMRFGTPKEKQNALWAIGMVFGSDSKDSIRIVKENSSDDLVSISSLSKTANDKSLTPEDANFGKDPNTVEEDSRSPTEVTRDDHQADSDESISHGIVATVSAGLTDDDSSVRDTAFDVMRVLPKDESSLLASSLLSDGDSVLQERLMGSLDGEVLEFDISLSLMGMGSQNENVRNQAAQNLMKIFGKSFSSQKEASEWYEANGKEFLQGAGN